MAVGKGGLCEGTGRVPTLYFFSNSSRNFVWHIASRFVISQGLFVNCTPETEIKPIAKTVQNKLNQVFVGIPFQQCLKIKNIYKSVLDGHW